MTGILGLYMFDERWRVGSFGRYGLLALQHRGEETAGLVTLGERFESIRGFGTVDEVLSDSRVRKLGGHLCLGQVSPYKCAPEDVAPLMVEGRWRVALTLDGKITDIEGYRWNPELSYERNVVKAFSEDLSGYDNPIDAVKGFFEKCRGGFSFITLDEEGNMVAGRDPLGVKPLTLGKMGFDGGIVSSETCVMDTIGERTPVSPAEDIEPGRVMVFTPLSARMETVATCPRKAYCSFEYVYLARPDSYVNGIPIYRVRKRIGELLAEENPVDADVVIGVPATAIPFAMAYSNATGIPIEKGFEQTGRRVRSAMKPTQFERLKGVQLKLNVIAEAVRGKRVILIDDSVVRGNTMANIVYLMKEKGAKEVHVRIGSPHIVSHCPFGTEVPPEDELIGRHLSEDKIAEVVGADSFHYLSLEGLVKAIGLPKSQLCLGCFTGEYPEVVG